MSRKMLASVIIPIGLAAAGRGAAEPERSTIPDDAGESWDRGAACEIQYYNLCTGWQWQWLMTPESAFDKVGVLVEGCGPAQLLETQLYVASESYAYYNWVTIHDVDEYGAPLSPPLATKSLWDCTTVCDCSPCSQWFGQEWGIAVPDPFMVVLHYYTYQWSWIRTDHPAAGPTGPPACGTCFPADRVSHTRSWPPGEMAGPGDPLSDGTCDAEMLFRASLSPVVAVQAGSWGEVKALYR